MRGRPLLIFLLAAAVVFIAGLPLPAQSVPAMQQTSMELLRLRGGGELHGMILEETDRGVHFLEINQPPGRPTFAVIQTISKDRVASLRRIQGEDRQQLVRLADQIRNRTQIRAAEKGSLRLTQASSEVLETDGAWHYQNGSVMLVSSLNEDTTRSLAVRADQIFHAFEHWFPPTRQPKQPIQIVLFGSFGSYSAYLKKIGLQIDNPAVYVPHTNQVLIGSELQTFYRRLEVTRQQHAQTAAEWEAIGKSLPDKLNQLAKRLKESSWSPDEITTEVQARREAWQRDFQQKLQQIKVTDRRNEAALQNLIDQTTQHLCHEAFHAYLENFLYPQDEFEVPVWLNEGLAQLFEHAQFENGTFRIDQPPQPLLKKLQERLRRDDGFSLQHMLQTRSGSFLLFENLHRNRLNYDVAWGLAWYLVFQKNLFAPGHLDQFVHRRGAAARETEQIFGEPVAQLQTEWTNFMLSLGS